MKKVLIILAILVLVAIGVAAWLYFSITGSGLPKREGEATLAGLGAEVSVRFDRWGVPHVRGASAADVAAAVGYLHANDRMTQLELGRRSCSGRVAELVGDGAFPVDRRSRLADLRGVAERWERAASAETRIWVEAYARGVNAWLEERGSDLPPALRATGVDPEPWTAVDTYCFAVLMGRDLSFPGGFMEDARFLLAGGLGIERTRQLIGKPDLHLPVAALEHLGVDTSGIEMPAQPASEEEAVDGEEETAGEISAAFMEGLEEVFPAGIWPQEFAALGSNNWAVGASRSTTGVPLVANDPHLPMNLPSIWYQVHLEAPGLKVAGMTIPGLPTVVVGQTDNLAWSVTNTGLDDHDLFLEQLDDSGTRVRRGDSWVEIESATQIIRARGGEEEEVLVQRTDLGPIIPANEDRGVPARSLRWAADVDADPLSAFINLARATTVDEVPAAIAGYPAPCQNLVVADRQGGLLFTLLGWVPERRTGDGFLYAPGWDPAYGWDGFRPGAEAPQILRPADDILVTANNDARPADYTLPVPANFAPGYRARRIRDRLEERSDWSAESFGRLQNDNLSLFARENVELAAGDYEGDAKQAYDALAAWDGSMELRGPAALYALFEREAIQATFFDEARASRLRPFAGWLHLGRLLRGEMSEEWFDDVRTEDVVEDRQATLAKALEEAWKAGRGRWGEDVGAWNYGILHPLIQRHPLGVLPLVGGWYNLGPVPAPGSPTSINAFAGAWQGDNQQTVVFGPSMRWVADLAQPDASLAMLPSGQSGHPKDPHYRDQLEGFIVGEIRPVAWSEEALAAATVSTLTLRPAP